jgi:hypothetical protein
VAERMKAYAPGEEVVFGLEFEYEGNREIETVEAVFVREGSGGEIAFLGDVRKGASDGAGAARYATQLRARIDPDAATGEYRCTRLSVRDRLDDDWDFPDVTRLDLIIRVERAPHRLKVTASKFL